jgi:hypothetical protein
MPSILYNPVFCNLAYPSAENLDPDQEGSEWRSLRKSLAKSVDSIGTLKGAHVLDDHLDLLLGHALDRFHVSEPPMMGSCTAKGSEIEGFVAMVARCIYSMQERRAFVRSYAVQTVTCCAEFFVGDFPENRSAFQIGLLDFLRRY